MIPRITEAEARAIVALGKFLPDDIEWSPDPDNSVFKVFSRPLVDATGTTIAGLTFEMKIRRGVYADDCKYSFSIFKFVPGGKARVFQLEVVPEGLRSHIDSTITLYGPHLHIGDKVEKVSLDNLDCRHHERWFREYLTMAGIGFGARYIGPEDGDLFA